MDSTLHRPAPLAPSALQAASLPAGTVLAGRFTIMAPAGRGGMGSVYRATDSLSGQPVALKLLHADSSEALQRFAREASVLSQLRHPGIVSYVAHGVTDNGLPFLAMEWLEGEDLAQCLSRRSLSLEQSLALLRNAAQALSLAHQHGVIHRDLKPSNLFLRDGRPEEVVLLDFGLARHVLPSSALTATQMVLGTPGYMAPEQASSQSALTPSADIFSLGCVLYECLTGKPPFAAPHFVAALAKILFAEPEPLRSLHPELPLALQELLERMLAKAPERRFPEAASLLAALVQLESRLEAEPSTAALSSAPVLRLGGAEQHLVSVLLAAPLSLAGQRAGPQDSQRALRDTLRTLLSLHGAQVELLADGSLVATLVASHGSATDPAALAARCALLIQERWPQAAVVLTTGRGKLDQHLPVGEAMDRAGQLLHQLPTLPPDSTAPVLLDEVTAGLLGPAFQLTRAQAGLFQLHGEQLGADASRPLLGKPTPCVGREQELALLELAFTTCVQEPVAQAVLLKAPAGAGKSRLRHEFLRRLEHQGQQVLVLLGRGDPLSAGSADGLLAQALRRLCGLSGTEPLEVRRARLSQRIAQHLPGAHSQEVAAFLGELCGIPFPDEHHPRLRAARGDPQLMSPQMGNALVTFLRAECEHHPVLLVLEDLHWGDVLSVRLMDEALRKLAEHPLMVLALARPEVEQLFPSLWAQRLQEVQLRRLSRKAGALLVREVLGPQVSDSLIDRLSEQAAGNALFLEELIRAVAEGQGEAAPQTVLAMLQARLGRLEPRARQVLLAASLFGRSFWPGAVRALLGEEVSASELEHWLWRLRESEWVEPQTPSRFPSESEYRFRHALVRDAAYALVPDSHKPTGHRLAGQWLEQRGESDPLVLAEHYHRGQQPEQAIAFYSRAAWQFYERHDMPGMERCAETAMALGPAGETLTHLQTLQAITALWQGQLARLIQLGHAALPKLKPGSLPWYWLAYGLYIAHAFEGRREQSFELEHALLSASPEARARAACMETHCVVSTICVSEGARETASAFMARLSEPRLETTPGMSPERLWSTYARSYFSFYFEARPWQACVDAEQTYRDSIDLGMVRVTMTIQVLWGLTLEALGDKAGAERHFRESMALSQQPGQFFATLYAGLPLALLLAGDSEPSRRQEARSLTSGWEEVPIPLYAGRAYAVKARIAAGDGDLAQAETWARRACELLAPTLFHLLPAQTLLSQVLLARGRAAEAREVAALGIQRLEQCASEGAHAVGIGLALAEACLAEGDPQAGEAALRQALQCVQRRARDIPDAAARERFLHQVPENARTLELARQRWGEAKA